MGGEAMVERGIVERMQHRRGRADDEAVEQHRHAAQARGEDRAGDRGDFAPAEAAQHFQRIAEMLAMQRDRRAHRVRLALQAGVVDAGAAADPFLRLPAVERVIDRRGGRRVADAHFAEARADPARRPAPPCRTPSSPRRHARRAPAPA